MEIKYSIKKLEPGDFNLLIPLMKDCFGTNADINYFKWKFVDNPLGFVIGFYAITESGEIAAYYGVIPELFEFDKVSIIVYQSCDTMTHSNHRRKGLFQKLATHCFLHLKELNQDFIYGFGGPTSTPGFLKFGWVKVFDMVNYFYPKTFTLFNFNNNKKNVYELENYDSIESIINKSNASSSIHSVKSIEKFKWRLKNPRYQYQVIAAKDTNQNFESYLVYYIMDSKIIIFDFYFGGKSSSKGLINFLKEKLKKSNYKGIVCLIQQPSIHAKSLREFSFISNPFSKGPLSEKTPFIIYKSNKNYEAENIETKWLINSFDHDSM